MAGGMTPGGRENLAPRVENTRARHSGHSTSDLHGKRPATWAAALSEATSAPHPPPVRHCWYDGPNGRQAALLLGWRNTGGHYDGRIAVAAVEPGEGWGIVEIWVSAEMLAPG